MGRFDRVSVNALGAMVSATGPVMLLSGLLLSVAVTVSMAVPATVGVPVITQPAPRVSPAGSVPAVMVQLYGELPPATPIMPVYGTPTVPLGGEDSDRPEAAAETVMLSGPVMDSTGLLASVALTITTDVPAVVGVPLTTQLADNARPAGNAPPTSRQLYGAVPPDTPTMAL